MLINIMEQDLKNAIHKVYWKMNFKDPITIISQIITDRVHHYCQYLLSDYLLENKCLYHYSKFYLPKNDLLRLHVCHKSCD